MLQKWIFIRNIRAFYSSVSKQKVYLNYSIKLFNRIVEFQFSFTYKKKGGGREYRADKSIEIIPYFQSSLQDSRSPVR